MTAADASASDTPFAGLGPDAVLDALDAVGLRGDGRLIQLNSYENRVFQVFLEDGRVVVAKFYRPRRWSDAQILEEHGFAAELAAAEIPVAACWTLTIDVASPHAPGVSLKGPTLAEVMTPLGAQRFCVTSRLAGRAPELEAAGTLEWLGRLIGRIHSVGALAPFRFRQTLNMQTFGFDNRDWLLSKDIIPLDAVSTWRSATDAALDAAGEAFDRVGALPPLRLHGDCHPGNVLWSADGPHFVDLDDAVTGPAIQDLWMLLSGNADAMRLQLRELLAGYTMFMPFDSKQRALIEPLRTLRMIHHSAWIARRWNDPAFPIAFPWFEGAAYWQQQARQLREQLDAMRAPPP
jgi:Ser/Thr protein kinase RdoA (MazF antagonist)